MFFKVLKIFEDFVGMEINFNRTFSLFYTILLGFFVLTYI